MRGVSRSKVSQYGNDGVYHVHGHKLGMYVQRVKSDDHVVYVCGMYLVFVSTQILLIYGTYLVVSYNAIQLSRVCALLGQICYHLF